MHPDVIQTALSDPSTRLGSIGGRVVHTLGEQYMMYLSAMISVDGVVGDALVGAMLPLESEDDVEVAEPWGPSWTNGRDEEID